MFSSASVRWGGPKWRRCSCGNAKRAPSLENMFKKKEVSTSPPRLHLQNEFTMRRCWTLIFPTIVCKW
jgi:hypothetical protein